MCGTDVPRGVDIPFTNYRQRLDLNFKAAVQTVTTHLNQNQTFPEFSFPAFSCLVFSCLAFSLPVFSCLVFSCPALWCGIFMSRIFTTCISDGAENSFLAFSVATLKYRNRSSCTTLLCGHRCKRFAGIVRLSVDPPVTLSVADFKVKNKKLKNYNWCKR